MVKNTKDSGQPLNAETSELGGDFRASGNTRSTEEAAAQMRFASQLMGAGIDPSVTTFTDTVPTKTRNALPKAIDPTDPAALAASMAVSSQAHAAGVTSRSGALFADTVRRDEDGTLPPL